MMDNYFYRLLIAVDQLLNTIFNGYPDETLSARAYREEQQGLLLGKIFRPLIDLVFFFEPDHCKSSFESELADNQLPPSYRKDRK